jgi:hypothetical protein
MVVVADINQEEQLLIMLGWELFDINFEVV